MKTLILFLISFFISSTTFAASYAGNFLNGDSRYILVGASMGIVFYVDRDSLAVELYDPPNYVLSIEVVETHENKIYRHRPLKFRYDYENRKIYTFDRDNNEIYIDPDVYYGEGTGYRIPTAEVAFALEYRLKFFGGEKIHLPHGSIYDFYDSIDFGRGTIRDSL